jgi:hypothetical protein
MAMTKKKLSKAHLHFLAHRRRKRLPVAMKLKIVNLDPKNAVQVEMQAGRRESLTNDKP